MTDWPVCIVCKEKMPRRKGESHRRWQARKVCDSKDDVKEVKCLTVFRGMGFRGEKKGGNKTFETKCVEAGLLTPVKKKKRSDAELRRLDAEQRRLDKEILRRETERWKQCGYESSLVRCLSQAEIAEYEHLYA